MFQAGLLILCDGAITFVLKSHLIEQEENCTICKKNAKFKGILTINSNFN